MKYKFILFFLILLSANIYSAINITFIEKPVLSVELLEGGSLLPNTTYYFAGFFAAGSQYTGDNVSPASNMVSITTTDTHKSVSLSWQAIPSPATKMYIRWDTENLQDGNGNYIIQQSDKWLNLCYKGFTGTNTTITSVSTVSNTYGCLSHPELSLHEDKISSLINRKKGICNIEITGTETWENLVSAIRASDAHDLAIINKNNMHLLCTISGTGTITLDKKSIHFLHTINKNENISYTHSNIFYSSNYGNKTIYGKLNYSSLNIYKMYQTRFSINTASSNNFYFVDSTGGVYQYSLNTDSKDSIYKIIGSFNLYNLLNNTVIKNKKFLDTYVNITLASGDINKIIYYENIIFDNPTKTYDIYAYGTTGFGYPQLNTVDVGYHSLLNVNSLRRENKIPLINFNDQSTWTIDSRFHFLLNYTINFNITDKDNNPIENATISIVDQNQNIYSLTTNQSGFATDDILAYKVVYDPLNQNGLRSQYQILNPLKIRVTAPGYFSYFQDFNLNTLENIKISLQEK